MLRSSRESSLFILLHLLSFICINHSFYSLFIYTLQIYSISPISRILSIYLEAVEHQRPLFILFNIILFTSISGRKDLLLLDMFLPSFVFLSKSLAVDVVTVCGLSFPTSSQSVPHHRLLPSLLVYQTNTGHF